MEPVRNHHNKQVVDAARLHRARARTERGETLIEGPNLLVDALEAGVVIISVFALPDDAAAIELADRGGLSVTLVDERAMGRLAGTETPRGPVAVINMLRSGLPHDRNVLVSWGVSDPGNVGTLIRTAAAFGWAYAYTEGSADPWSPKTLRAGAGGQFQTSIARVEEVSDLEGWTTVATVVRGGGAPEDVEAQRVAVLIGEEAAGLPVEVSSRCDLRVTIPTPGPTESLNAAVAAGMVVYVLSNPGGHGGVRV